MDLTTAPKLTEKGRATALQMEEQIDKICHRLPPIVVPDVSALLPYDFTPTLKTWLNGWLLYSEALPQSSMTSSGASLTKC
jgi:hypothetical protein